MNRTQSLLFACALAAGCGSSGTKEPTPPTPSVSAIEPAEVFLARTVDVHLSGYATNWSDATTVNFGDGVTINKVTAGSPTALTINLTIAPTAKTGVRDVTVMDGSNMETYAQSFAVSSPVTMTFQGVQAQGSIFTLHVDNHDLDNPFDTTNTPSLFGAPTFTNLALTAPMGVAATFTNVTPFSADATVLVDVTAMSGGADLDVVSGPPMGASDVHFPVPGGLTLMARTATAIAAGAPATGMVQNPFDSSLYSLTPGSGTNIVELTASADASATMAQPAFALLPKSGAFADILDYAPAKTIVTTTDPFYVVYWDSTGTAGYSFSITRTDTPAAYAMNEAEPNDNRQTQAQSLTALPAVVQQGSFSSPTDEDWYSYTAAQGDVGKMFHVQTIPGDFGTDVIADVVDNTGASLGGPSQETGGQADFTSTAIPKQGTYFIHLTMGQFGDPTQTNYVLIVRLQ